MSMVPLLPYAVCNQKLFPLLLLKRANKWTRPDAVTSFSQYAWRR